MSTLKNNIVYKVNVEIKANKYLDLLSKTSLGQRRPSDLMSIDGMLKNSNLIISAWLGGSLVGVSRSLTDYYFCCYLSDLVVSEEFQNDGIGRKLIDLTAEKLQPNCTIVLLAAPQAMGYYPKMGFSQHTSAWVKKLPKSD